MKYLPLFLTFSTLAARIPADEPLTLKLWPDNPPTAMTPKSEATQKTIAFYGGITATRLSDVTERIETSQPGCTSTQKAATGSA